MMNTCAAIKNNHKFILIHLSTHKDALIDRPQDFGIAPLPIKPTTLTSREISKIENCDKYNSNNNNNNKRNRKNKYHRKYLFSFTGRPRIPFPEFQDYFENRRIHKQRYSNNKDVHVTFTRNHYHQSNETNSMGGKIIHALPPHEQGDDNYHQLIRNSIFAGSPRGDCLFSYRFSEILSAGTIPVLYADGMVLPFTKNVVDWNNGDAAVILLAQDDVYQTMDILRNYTHQELCQMSKNALSIYNNYVKDSHARLRGILEVLDSRLVAAMDKDNDIDNDNNAATTTTTTTTNRTYYQTFSVAPGNIRPRKPFLTC